MCVCWGGVLMFYQVTVRRESRALMLSETAVYFLPRSASPWADRLAKEPLWYLLMVVPRREVKWKSCSLETSLIRPNQPSWRLPFSARRNKSSVTKPGRGSCQLPYSSTEHVISPPAQDSYPLWTPPDRFVISRPGWQTPGRWSVAIKGRETECVNVK